MVAAGAEDLTMRWSQRPPHRVHRLSMTSYFPVHLTRALVRRRSACSR